MPPQKAADGILRDLIEDTVSPASAYVRGNMVLEKSPLSINCDTDVGTCSGAKGKAVARI